jgi:ABC-type transport system involved in multi-copper enzyme maturation permease subunit
VIHDWLVEGTREGHRAAWWRRIWPLANFEFRSLFRSRWGVALFGLCLVPGVARLVMLLMVFGVVNFGPPGLRMRLQNRAEIPGLDPWRVDFYLDPVLSVMPGLVFVLLLTSLVVARTIARDRMANALELYWTRGISPLGYVTGKWLGGFLLVATVTMLVPLALWVTAVFLAEDWTLFTGSALSMLMALVGLLLATIVWTSICLAISAIASAPNTAMVAWCMLLVGSSALGVVMANALREPWLRSCLSIWDAGGVIVRAVAGVPQGDVSIQGAAATLSVTCVLLALFARTRLRLGEAVR